MKNNFLIRAPFRGSSGYANVNRNIILALHKLGHRVFLEPIIWASDNTQLSEEEETRLAVIEKDNYLNIPSYEDTLILNLTIPELYKQKSQGVNIGWYIFEADRVPENWKKHINKMDAIITPTQFNLQQLRTAGYEKPIFLLKEGVNYRLFNPEIKPLFRKDKFSFLLVAVAQERKRWREVITGYLE